MFKEEIMLRQKRAELEGFAARQRLLKEAQIEPEVTRFRRSVAVVLLSLSKWLEPEVRMSITQETKCETC
jgi:hypothetical protein